MLSRMLDKRLERLEDQAQQRDDARRREWLPFATMSDAELTAHIEGELAKLTEAEQAAFWAEWEAEHDG